MTRASDTARTLSGGAVFNEGSNDVDLRVESNGQANMLFVDGGNDAVIIQDTTSRDINGAGNKLQINHTDYNCLSMAVYKNAEDGAILTLGHSRNATIGSNTILQDGDFLGGITFVGADGTDLNTQGARIEAIVDGTPGANDMPTRLVFRTTADGASSTTERMRITSDGVVLVGQTSFAYGSVGCSMTSTGQLGGTANGDSSLILNRTSSEGTTAQFRYDNNVTAGIAITNGGNILSINGLGSGLGFHKSASTNIVYPFKNNTTSDNVIDLGSSGVRFDDIYATNASIQTSDKNEKQDIEELNDAEKRVAVAAKSLMRKYRWKSAVAEKGENARTHFGIIAQDLQDAFTAEGLDASKYAMFCSNTWFEKEITVDAVEAKDAVYEEVTDSDGMKTSNLISSAVEAKDAYTYTHHYSDGEEVPSDATKKTRLGVRYSELLAFIISAL
jgi:prepilin-type processing-associated H-X9-DG protein